MKVDFIKKIQHIGIPAHDLEISIPFYERLGFENVMESPFEFDGGYGTCVMMKNHEVIVELYQMPEKQLAEIKRVDIIKWMKEGRSDLASAYDFKGQDINGKYISRNKKIIEQQLLYGGLRLGKLLRDIFRS